MKRRICTACVVMLCAFSLSVRASGTDDKIGKIQESYKTIKDLKGSFVQKNVIKSLNKTDTYKGNFYIKYPMKMKWMYKGKASQDVTINNEKILIYKKGDNQAYRGTFNKSTYGQTPIALLGGFGDMREEFAITSKDNTLILKPKQSLGTITSLKLVLSDSGFPIRSFTIYDGSLNIIEIELHDISVNSGLQDAFFDLSLPKGVNVFDQNP